MNYNVVTVEYSVLFPTISQAGRFDRGIVGSIRVVGSQVLRNLASKHSYHDFCTGNRQSKRYLNS
jgi:hypothetical protein